MLNGTQDKTTALVSSEAGRRRAEEQVAQAQVSAQQAQAALAVAHAQLRKAEQRSAPGVMVPVAEVQKLLLELEQAQQQYGQLERQHAALQHRVPGCGGGSSSSDHSGPSIDGIGSTEGVVAGGRTGRSSAGGTDDSALPAWCSVSQLRCSSSKAYRPCDYGAGSGIATAQQAGPVTLPQPGPSQAAAAPPKGNLAAQLLERDVALFDAQLQRDQAEAEAQRHRRRLHSLLSLLSPHAHDAEAASAIAKAREAAGLPPLPSSATHGQALNSQGAKAGGSRVRPDGGAAAATAGAGKGISPAAGRRRRPTEREQELLDTVALLKAALERTKKGLESGVSSSKYMAAVDKAKQLKSRCLVGV